MSRINRMSGMIMLIACGISLALLMPGWAGAKTVTWKMATKMPASSPEGKAFQKLADLVKVKSHGKMVVQVFPTEQLGKTEAVMEQLQAGLIHLYPEGSSYLQKYEKNFVFVNAPFLFKDRAHWVRFMDTDMVNGWFRKIEAEHNIMVLGKVTDFVRGPFRVMVSKQPVNGLADLQGIKLRLHPDDMAIAGWKHLGANVMVLPWTEIYESLGRGIIQACNSPMALVESMKFYEQAKYITRHNEFPQGMAFMMNARKFRELSPELQRVLLEAHREASAFSAKIMNENAAKSISRMEKQGVNYSEMDTKPLVEKMSELYEQWDAQGKMPQGMLDIIHGL